MRYECVCQACGSLVDLHHELSDDGDGPCCPWCGTSAPEAFPDVDLDDVEG